MASGITTIGAILAITGTALVTALLIHVALRLYDSFEGFVADKLAEDAGYDVSNAGDVHQAIFFKHGEGDKL
jgi:hypothetical protein